MPRTRTDNAAFISLREQRIAGADLGWPALRFVTASEGFAAERVAWHGHEGHELLMILGGAAEYEFRGGRRLSVAGGQFLIVPPGIRHRSVGDMRSPTVHSSIIIDLLARGLNSSPFTVAELKWLRPRLNARQPEVRAMPLRLKQLVRALHQAVVHQQSSAPAPENAASLRFQAARILIEAARAGDDTPARDDAGVAASAIAYLERRFTDPVQMDMVAEAVQCSRSKLYSAFRRETGMSPNDWLLRLRVRKAQTLLTSTRRPVKDIALAAGFSSHAYFCQVFRKYTGRVPASRRKE